MVALARACQRRLRALHAVSLAQRQQRPATSQTDLGPSRTDAGTQSGTAVEVCEAGTQTSEPAAERGGPKPGSACREDGLGTLEPCMAVSYHRNRVRCHHGRACRACCLVPPTLQKALSDNHAGVHKYLAPHAAL